MTVDALIDLFVEKLVRQKHEARPAAEVRCLRTGRCRHFFFGVV